MKNSYGFDMDFPGAVVDAPVPASAAERRTLGEEQIRWIFDLYSDEGTPRALSSMITIFEVCDNPASATSAEPPFFGASFPATPHALDPDAPPIVGTRALSAIVALAGKLDQGRIVRHYFDLLYWRWALSADRKIREMEQLVGIEWQGKGKLTYISLRCIVLLLELKLYPASHARLRRALLRHGGGPAKSGRFPESTSEYVSSRNLINIGSLT